MGYFWLKHTAPYLFYIGFGVKPKERSNFMKKVLIVIVALAVAGIAIWGAMNLTKPEEALLAEILPQDIAFYYSIQNTETIWKNIKTSRFWREFSNIKLWTDIQVASGVDDLKNQFKENIGIELTEQNLMKLIGRELAISIAPGTSENDPPKILLLCRGKNNQSLTEVVNPIIDKIKEQDPTRIEKNQYQGKTITKIKSASADQPDIYLVLLDNILIVGLGDTETNIKNVLDISSGKSSKSLAATENFKKVTELIGAQKNLAALFYMDFSKMRKYLKGLQALQLPGAEQSPQQAITGIDMLDFMGGWSEIKDGLITKIYLYPNLKALDPEMKKVWETSPRVPGTLKFIPEKTLLYFIWSSIDLSTIWDIWQENLKQQAPAQIQPILTAIDNFKQEWGLDLNTDVFPLISDEIAFVFSDLITEGIMPIPKLGLMIKVKDKKKVDKLIEDLIAKNNEKATEEAAKAEQEATAEITEETTIEVTTEEGEVTEEETAETIMPALPKVQLNLTEQNYGEHTMKVIQLPLVGALGLSPAYTYLNDYLILAINTKTLQEMIDVTEGKINPLTHDSEYADITEILPKKNNQSSYINFERLLDIGVGICNLVSLQTGTLLQLPTPSDPEEAKAFEQQKAQAEATIATLNNSVIPLLKTLKAVRVVATAAVNKKDHTEQTLVLRVQDI